MLAPCRLRPRPHRSARNRARFPKPRDRCCRVCESSSTASIVSFQRAVARNRPAADIGRVKDDVNDDSRALLAAGAVLGGLGVALGAFAAHGLSGRISAEALGWWHTAVEYQMWHAVAVLALALSRLAWARLPAWMMAGGAIVFSGTL